MHCMGLPWWLRQKRIHLRCRRPGFDPWVRKIPWRREWLPTPVFLPGESHGQRSVEGYSPPGHKKSDTTEWLALSHALCTNVALLTTHCEVKVPQLHPTLCDPHGLCGSRNSLRQDTGVGSLFPLQGIFPTQGSNPGLLHCRLILYQLSHKGSP